MLAQPPVQDVTTSFARARPRACDFYVDASGEPGIPSASGVQGDSQSNTKAVSARSLIKDYGQGGAAVRAVDGVSFDVDDGELLVLLGPSGCGKTTTLRMIAGLEEPDGGDVWLGSRLVSSSNKNLFLPTEKRNVGMVFQSYAIWPHMSVFENVAYPLRVRRTPRGEVRDRVEKTLALLGLEGFAGRPATHLSGGQQQRVALARAIVFEPRILLLDEPLSNLDAKLRVHMRTELKHLQRQTGLTSIFVTHDQAESMALADRIIVMNGGHIEQIGSPADIYERPRSRFVSEFVGTINVLPASVTSVADSSIVLLQNGREIHCALTSEIRVAQGDQVMLSIRPEKLSLLPRHTPTPVDGNAWHGRIASVAYYGDHREYDVELPDQERLLKVTTPAGVALDRGEHVVVTCDPSEVLVMAPD
jgi:ABC-type Fe3+/spermidine/putrescine transport system ATPase subunit